MSTAVPMFSARINVFQRLMRRWEAVHPYNAVQALRLRGVPDRAALQSAWQSALSATGLGAVAVEGDRYRFEPLNGHAASYAVRFPQASFCDHVSAELNRPFDDPHEPPFRPFAIADADDPGTYYVGLVYQHWLADSASIRMLMREWFVRAFDPGAAIGRPLRMPTVGYGDGLCGGRDALDVAVGLLGLARRHCRMRRVQKVSSTNLSDTATGFSLYPADDGLIDGVRAAAARRHVKVTDLFLATLAQACADHVPLQRRPNRTDVAVASVVDLRPGARADLSRTFGLYLGFTNVACRGADLPRFNRLVSAVARQTRHQKTLGIASASMTWISTGLLLSRLGSPESLYHFYRKDMPLTGAMSNLDLSGSWVGQYAVARGGPVLDYVRTSPTGPLAPLVMTTTTLGGRFHVGLTYRTGLIDRARADNIAGAVLGRLRSLA